MSHLEVFYTSPNLIDLNSGLLRIAGQESHHISHVLRHKPGDVVMVVDGVGHGYWVLLKDFSKDSVRGEIQDEEMGWGESKVPIGLIIPALKGARMDTVIEKSTELGVRWFLLPQTQYAVAKANPNKLERWRRIALSAMKQCGRSYLPMIQSFPDLASAFEACRRSVGAFAENGPQFGIVYAKMGAPSLPDNTHISDQIRTGTWKAVFTAVGPEGGFSEEEIGQLQDTGALPYGLGKRRLRSDTAAIVSMTLVGGIMDAATI